MARFDCRRRSPGGRFALSIAAASAVALASGAAHAGVNSWTPLGPDGGTICTLAVAPSDPSVVYSAWAGLFRSEDGGSTWSPVGAPATGDYCLLSVDAADPDRLHALRSDAVLRSLDGGRTWTSTPFEPPALAPLYPVAVGASDPDFLLFSSFDKVFRSLDRGESWQETWGTEGLWVASTALDPLVAGRAYAVTRYRGIYVSEDYGGTWALLGADFANGTVLESLHFDPRDPSTFFLVTRFGIWRSRDRGVNWTRVLPPSTIFAAPGFAILPDSTLFSLQTESGRKFLMRSANGGDSWQDLGSPFPERPDLDFTRFTASQHSLLVSGYGIRKSDDRGASWRRSVHGLMGTTPVGFELDRQDPTRLFALLRSAVPPSAIVRSVDRGATWSPLPLPSVLGDSVLNDLEVDPEDPDRYFVATHSLYGQGLKGLFVSEDAGENWSLHGGDFTCFAPFEVAIDPLETERLFLAGGQENHFCAPDCYNWRSEDRGGSWQCISPGGNDEALRKLAPSPFEAGVVLSLGTQGIYRSTNAGSDWTRVAERPAFVAEFFSDLAWANATTAYATSANFPSLEDSGLFVSHDGGVSWQPSRPDPGRPPGLPWLTDLVVDPFRPGTVYALSKEAFNADAREVVRSTDGGLTWSPLVEGLLGWPLHDLALDPVTPNRLYVSTYGGGVLAYDLQVPEPCVPSGTALCITEGRFRIESLWRDFAGHSGVGHAVPLASDTGSFWFFSPENLELFVKEIDGVSYNNAFWTYYGALSNVEFTLLATDTATGAQHGYFNRSGRFASQGDIQSFPQEEAFVAPASAAAPSVLRLRRTAAPQRSANACVPDATTLCLQTGRFAASVTWRDFVGRRGTGTPIVLTPDTGSFWFFDAGIHELAVKVIDGLGTNGSFWVYYGSLSNVEFDLTVVDSITGDIWTRHNPSGTFASGGDIEAFPQLP